MHILKIKVISLSYGPSELTCLINTKQSQYGSLECLFCCCCSFKMIESTCLSVVLWWHTYQMTSNLVLHFYTEMNIPIGGNVYKYQYIYEEHQLVHCGFTLQRRTIRFLMTRTWIPEHRHRSHRSHLSAVFEKRHEVLSCASVERNKTLTPEDRLTSSQPLC